MCEIEEYRKFAYGNVASCNERIDLVSGNPHGTAKYEKGFWNSSKYTKKCLFSVHITF